MGWSIVVFCYNEASSIRRVLEGAVSVMDGLSPDYEIIIIDDGSTDDTAAICTEACTRYHNMRLISHLQNRGIGAALRTGYEQAEKEYVCAIPGDGQFEIRLLRQVPAFGEDCFYSFYRGRTDYNWYRSLLTWGNKAFNRILLGISVRDVNWIKVYTRSQLSRASISLSSSLIETEICAKLISMDIRPVELPSEYLQRTGGVPKGGNLRTLLRALSETARLIAEVRRFRSRRTQHK